MDGFDIKIEELSGFDIILGDIISPEPPSPPSTSSYGFIVNLTTPTSIFGITFDTSSAPPEPPTTEVNFNGILNIYNGEIIETDLVTNGMIMRDNGDIWLNELIEV